jgi:hypothetical protein
MEIMSSVFCYGLPGSSETPNGQQLDSMVQEEDTVIGPPSLLLGPVSNRNVSWLSISLFLSLGMGYTSPLQ